MMRYFDRVAVNIATAGTGTVTVGAVTSAAFMTPAEALAVSGDIIFYMLTEGNDFEIGIGTFGASAATMSRDTVLKSKIGGAVGTTKMTLAGAAVLRCVAPQDAIGHPRGHIWGLTLSNNGSDATNDIDIAVGEAVDDDGKVLMIQATAGLTKRIDASWAVGDGNGGMDTGSVANSTWYAVWLIRRSDTGVVDALFSLSATAPTMPTGYDSKRRIGAVRRGTATNLAFTQSGDRFTLAGKINDASITTTATAAAVALTVPPSTIALFRAVLQLDVLDSGDDGGIIALLSEIAETDVNPGVASGIGSLSVWGYSTETTKNTAGHFELMTNASSQIRYDFAAFGTGVVVADGDLDISTYGWIDQRGRLA